MVLTHDVKICKGKYSCDKAFSNKRNRVNEAIKSYNNKSQIQRQQFNIT
jgi:hypothetical protein